MTIRFLTILASLILCGTGALAQTLGSAFTYQGQLTEAGQPATGLYDLQVCLFDDPSAGNELACSPDLDDVPVEDGAFTVALDFGAAVFVGDARWIELRIRAGADTGGYTVLLPRQPVRPAPEALRAARADSATTADSALVADSALIADTALSADTAATADSATTADTANNATTADTATTALSADSTPWTGLTDVPAGFADGVDDNSGGTVTEITAGTGLEGGPITTTGTIGIADGGVGAAQIATSAVGTDQIQDGAVGAPDIDPTQVQARVFGTCEPGFYVRGINADGSVLCSPLVNQNRFFSIRDTLFGGGTGVGNLPSIAIGSDGNPIISHKAYTGPLGLIVAHCTSPVCSGNITQTLIDSAGNVGSSSSLVIGNDGLPIVSYEDFDNGALKVAKCNDIACATPATITTVDDPPNAVGEWISMAIGADGLPVIAYHDKTAGALKVAKCSSADCTGSATITVVDDNPVNDVGQSLSLAIGDDGFPVIAYHDATDFRLNVAKCLSEDCSVGPTITTVSSGGVNYGTYPSIAIGDDGLPVISYFTGFALNVAKCTDAACTAPATVSLVDSRPTAGPVGFWTSIEISPGGRPSISYYDGASADPRFVRCANADCSGPGNEVTQLVTADGQDGSQTSLALRPDGAPIIAHWRFQPQTLGVVVCGTLSCQ